MANTMDPVACAIKGDVDFFKGAELALLRDSRDELGDSVLSLATIHNRFNCCKEIYKRCPSLLYIKNSRGHTALHQAAWNGRNEIIKYLIRVAAKMELEDIESGGGQKLLTETDNSNRTALHLAVNKERLEIAKLLIEADPTKKLLGMVDWMKNTALHTAVKNHNLEIVKLLVEADPEFIYGTNTSGDIPLWIAWQEALTGDQRTVGVNRLLLAKQPSQSKTCIGDKEWTLLHHAAYKGDLITIEDITRFCPDCMELVDIEGRNFLHLAAKLEHLNVVKHTLGIARIADSVLNGQDKYGDTPLHIAALTGNTSVTLALLYDPRVRKMAMNMQGQKALDAINFDYDKRKAGVYGVTDRVDQKEIKEQSEFDLLVGALIAAVSFTAGITVPGGYTSEGTNKGTAILYNKISFEIFVLSNTTALLLSLYSVFSHFCTKRLRKKENIIYQLNVANSCSLGAIFAMVVAFITGSYTVLAVSIWLAITVCVFCCCFFIFAFRAMWRMIIEDTLSAP